MVWGERAPLVSSIAGLTNPDSSLHVNDQVRFPLDPKTWVEYLSDFDFVLGTRIHGSVAGILSGTPTLLIAHDSRTRELAEYHAIPYVPINQVTEDARAEDLYGQADYSQFHARQVETFDRFTKFLEKNDLPNIYQTHQQANDFDERLSTAELPPMVHPVLAGGHAGRQEVVSRLEWLRQGKKTDRTRLQYAFKPALPHSHKPEITAMGVDRRLTKELKAVKAQLTKSQKLVSETQEQLAQTRKLVEAQSKVIKRLDVPIPRRAKRYAKRLVAKLRGI